MPTKQSILKSILKTLPKGPRSEEPNRSLWSKPSMVGVDKPLPRHMNLPEDVRPEMPSVKRKRPTSDMYVVPKVEGDTEKSEAINQELLRRRRLQKTKGAQVI